MVERKIFAGAKVRRIRNGLGLTQTAMAETLEISPSYLNLIERNQRPLTVQLLLKLATAYKVDLDELRRDTDNNLPALREVFADPLLAGELPGDQELSEIVQAAPNAASAIVKLYRAYREQAERLSDLAAVMADGGPLPALARTRLPADEVRDVLERRSTYFHEIEQEAETFVAELDGHADLPRALSEWMRSAHGITVRVLPVHVMPDLRRRFDRHSARLFISERLSPSERHHELAIEAALLRLNDSIQKEVDSFGLTTPEAKRLARFELARIAASAILMPYGAFLNAAQTGRYDVEILSARFSVAFHHVAARLTMLQRPGASLVPFFLMEIDAAGHRLKRAGASGFPQGRFGGHCPKLNIHQAFLQPGQLLAEAVEMPDGTTFLTIARTSDGPMTVYGERVRRTAVLLGCDLSFAEATVYAQAVAATKPVAIGPACRLCERRSCLSRAEPPVTRPLALDGMTAGLSPFDFR
ncbi:helix-turn-helix domain-containing protein [Oryzifoliimicrobium ureilyticus]|uniref:helix-turn-helix domain-containing protein n=1 Tax=Oryzifoliimicrobium ureilyticus TaxID=3113724 RepID=UPI0030762AC3